MITKENFKNVLIALGFEQDGKKFFKIKSIRKLIQKNIINVRLE